MLLHSNALSHGHSGGAGRPAAPQPRCTGACCGSAVAGAWLAGSVLLGSTDITAPHPPDPAAVTGTWLSADSFQQPLLADRQVAHVGPDGLEVERMLQPRILRSAR